MRRTSRAVTAAARMAEDSAASLPAQAQTWKATKAVYRLLAEPAVTFEALGMCRSTSLHAHPCPPSDQTRAQRRKREKEVARMGGYLARRVDGPPGWKTIWTGWLHLHALLEGVHSASHHPL